MGVSARRRRYQLWTRSEGAPQAGQATRSAGARAVTRMVRSWRSMCSSRTLVKFGNIVSRRYLHAQHYSSDVPADHLHHGMRARAHFPDALQPPPLVCLTKVGPQGVAALTLSTEVGPKAPTRPATGQPPPWAAAATPVTAPASGQLGWPTWLHPWTSIPAESPTQGKAAATAALCDHRPVTMIPVRRWHARPHSGSAACDPDASIDPRRSADARDRARPTRRHPRQAGGRPPRPRPRRHRAPAARPAPRRPVPGRVHPRRAGDRTRDDPPPDPERRRPGSRRARQRLWP